eukprot:COSAG04_NODE_1372_length_7033_cov_5.257571_7_plen_191_part_00
MINHLEGGLGTPTASPHQGRAVPPSPAAAGGGGEGDDTPVLAAAAAAAKREAIAAAVISKRESIEAAALANKQAMASANAFVFSPADQSSDGSMLECRRWRRDGTRRRKPKRRGSSGYDSHTLPAHPEPPSSRLISCGCAGGSGEGKGAGEGSSTARRRRAPDPRDLGGRGASGRGGLPGTESSGGCGEG